jgi:hypothetical protein
MEFALKTISDVMKQRSSWKLMVCNSSARLVSVSIDVVFFFFPVFFVCVKYVLSFVDKFEMAND